MYTEIFLRLEPLGLELVAGSLRQAGHDVRLIDLQASRHDELVRLVDDWRPDAFVMSANYLANIPEVIDLAKMVRRHSPRTLVVVGGHSVSFTASEVLEPAAGAIDCVVKGEGEEIMPLLL